MGVERVFERKLRALRSRLQSDEPYDVLDAATIMYHLLCDGLLKQTVERTRAEVTFYVRRSHIGDVGVGGQTFQQTVMPIEVTDNTPEHLIDALSLGKFLAYPVTILDGETFTVRDILQVAANSLGGKHYGEPRDRQARLRPLFARGEDHLLIVFPNGLSGSLPPLVLDSVRRIGSAVVASIAPLERQISNRSV